MEVFDGAERSRSTVGNASKGWCETLLRNCEALAYKDGPVVIDAVVDPYALSLPSHVPFHTAEGYTLSLAKQVLAGRFDDVIKTMERNVSLV
jgi:hypothetical protein